MKIGELLLEAGLVEAHQIEAALHNKEGLRLGSALIAARAIEPDVIARTLAQQIGVPPAKSADLVTIDPAARAMVPDALCKRLWALPYAVHGTGTVRVLEVAMRDPEDQGAINELKIAAGMRIDARVAPELLLREALHPRTELPASTGRVAGPGPGGELELELDDRVPRGPGHGRRGTQRSPGPSTVPPLGVPLAAGATALPGAAPGQPPLPPLVYDNTTTAGTVTRILKWVLIIAALVAVGYVVLRFKQCMTPTTKSVGTHYDSKLLGLGIDFPDQAGWRVSFNTVKVGAAKSEFFYRGGVPELPVVAMLLIRGPAEEVGTAARRAFTDLVTDAQTTLCEPSPDRAGAIVCRGGGTLMLFGRRNRNIDIEVHAWSLSTGELAMAVWLNPDRTLSETGYVLSSIVEQ